MRRQKSLQPFVLGVVLSALTLIGGCMARTPTPTTQDQNHTEQDPMLSSPTFSVMNHKGEERTGRHLHGHPTVLWFYPMAGTPG